MSKITRCWWRWRSQVALASWLAIGGAFGEAVLQIFASSFNCALAQPVADDTLGAERSVVTPNVLKNGLPSEQIDGGAIRGINLFHSFREFNVEQGRGAYFTNPAGIENILSRVTGGNASKILGRLGVLGDANLFLINPNGIIFGPNASLDVRGSFVASTASSLKFADGKEFSATAPQATPLLTVSVPLGLQYGGNPRSISNQSKATNRGESVGLKVQPGKTLALVGGDVNLDGGILKAPGGRVELGGVSGEGTVELNFDGNNLNLSFPNGVAKADVSLANEAIVDVTAEGGGSIAVNARNINALGGSSLRAGISLSSQVDGAQAGDITLNASEAVRVENSSIYNIAFGFGNGGNLIVDTGQLIVRDGIVATATASQGRAGDLNVKAKDSVELSGSDTSNGTVSTKIPINIFNVFDVPIPLPIGLFSASIDARNILSAQNNSNLPPILNVLLPDLLPTAGGNAGKLTIETGRLIVRNGAVVSPGTTTAGNAGDLTVKADFIELSGTSANNAPSGFEFIRIADRVPSGLRNGTAGSGSGGNLTIETEQLIVRDGAVVGTNTGGSSSAGELTVNAKESVELSGTSANGFPSLLATATRSSGNANSLTINTKQLRVSNGAIISAATLGSGLGGGLTINATESVELIGTSTTRLPASAFQGVFALPADAVFREVLSPSGVITGTLGEGNANSLTINTGRLSIGGGAQASVSTIGAGNAGSLIVNASSIELSGTSTDRPNLNDIVGRSLLTTAVGSDSTGKGGDITVQANSLTITDGAALTASTSGQKDAGNITLEVSDRLTLTGEGSGLLVNTAKNAAGKGGDLTVNTGQLIVQDGAQVNVGSEGIGNAGNLKVTSSTISLNNKGAISARTASGNGGDITLNVSDLLLLRRGSEISTTAGTAGAGNGGNITINAKDGFIVTVPGENSDITANAFSGSGGRVTIDATNIFGMVARSREDLVRLLGTNDATQLDPRRLPTNDITAISQENPSLSGLITIDTLNTDLSSSLVNLPAVPVDTSIAQGCTAGGSQAQSEFIVTGRGGLPPNPKEVLTPDAVQVDWVTRNPKIEKNSKTVVSPNPTSTAPTSIVEATGWTFGPKGEVIFTAQAVPVQHENSWQPSPQCHES